ncbi:serine hydrolase [Bacillus sp. FJAT-22090]|uniref:serine hydrolase domain-containing protein n=1 Tax=Bacillus sp. FJAT-22090 TaxID=1581038 RepID=UPI0021B19DE8|nr:serine hydrolase [Bacillus sp. FJAT-22090]
MRKVILFVMFILLISQFPLTALAAPNRDATPSGIPYSELKQRVDKYAANYIGKTTTGAAVAIVKDGELIINSSYGFANLEKKIEVGENTVFEWGSATKLLVWTSVMQLVEQGKLNLEEDIQTYLPQGFFNKLKYDTPITMLNLMHHDAGWEDKYTDLFYLSAEDVSSLENTLRISEPSQINEPGEVVAYSNYGVALAGYIVEKITEQPFSNYVNEHIFGVLDMKDTSIHPSQEDNKSVALKREYIHGYLGNGDSEFSRSPNDRIYIGLYPAGSAIGTAEDAAKFIAALMPKKGKDSPLFESNTTLNKMLTTSDHYDDGIARNAHGFWHGMYAVDVLEHGGNTDSFSSNFTFSKEENLGVIVMTNQTAESGLSYGLSVLVYGDYVYEDGAVALSTAFDLEGSYMQARQVYKGFSKLMGVFMTGHLKAEDETTFTFLSMTFKQVAPYLYRSTDEHNLFLHFSKYDGKVEKVSMMISDMIPMSKGMKGFVIFSCFAAVISVLYLFASLLVMIVNSIGNRRKSVVITPIKKWSNLMNLAGIMAFLNMAILAYRTLYYASYASLKIHFWIYYAYIAIAIIGITIIVIQWKKVLYTKIQNMHYVVSSIVAFLLTVLIFGWELYK